MSSGDSPPKNEITALLAEYHAGDEEAFHRLVPLVYDDLLVIARRQLSRWRPGGTLDTTDLVHEAYLRFVDQALIELEDREQFFAIAAHAMRLILVDHARARCAKKRGGGRRPESIDGIEVGQEREMETILALDGALRRLGEVSERLARVFECRFFGGLSEHETAKALDLSLRTVQRDWMKARAWLRRELKAG